MITTEAKPEAMTVRKLLDPKRGERYLIPRYQRNYAWGEGEISQLIRDVEDYRRRDEKAPYYIGTLVVHQKPDIREYETVDGQQRLTTLSILMAYLRREKVANAEDFTEPVIRFQSRAKSEQVLKEIFSNNDVAFLDTSSSLAAGFGLVGRALTAAHTAARESGDDREWGDWLESFSRYLCHQVVIFRVHVPADTDLNHYFEVMNSRGEQLEKHEVLKADLMGVLEPDDGHTFAKIWEACANMEKYVQMSFARTVRTALFGSGWDGFTPPDFEATRKALEFQPKPAGGNESAKAGGEDDDDDGEDDGGGMRLRTILKRRLITAKQEAGEEGHPDQFHPVINFPNFLLHVLSLHAGTDSITLDDKNLLGVFEEWLLEKVDKKRKAVAVKDFTYDLLRARYLFDQYVMKRDLRGGSDKWSLLRMKMSSTGSNSYANTFGDDSQAADNRRLLMLQAALHISNPSMSYKYWLLGALRFLMTRRTSDSLENGNLFPAYLGYLESMARGFVFDIYLAEGEGRRLAEVTAKGESWPRPAKSLNPGSGLLRYGGIRNNLLFNFLDYLLWVGNGKTKFREGKENEFQAEDFRFTPRSSVEHHYPQHPVVLGDDVHRFGNLYLISHSKNSKLSNFSADSKKNEFLRSGTVDSLKQQFMIDGEVKWDLTAINNHEKKMLAVLSAAIEWESPPFDPSCLKVD